ncbi:type III-A CRISPR-associated RAMP protein Csm4 [Thermococcus waiotapuensis]|uniref:CRISPR system Cms protein Csm4 n=1 Tax=Thermococcus waiotapuensis TaxID=90909 RepID=A0AAE4T3E8_9EURY|nr:type III-A CRISPR-associated RAMP protein Csm4 [Thermococcus waiotapuensis]MDV3103748.1 type III-A CRISPR-associated RAMP protein Csm4 [Thermococcus waiotapuensis]
MPLLKFKAVKLIPRGPVRGLPRADTIFGAIGNAIATLFGARAVDELVEGFERGARISSAFPFEGDTYYFPKPLSAGVLDLEELLKDLSREERYALGKAMKKVTYLNLENFEKALRLEPFGFPTVLPFRRVNVPRVALDRVTSDSSLYFWDEVRFKENSGLYFLYSGDEDIFNDYILPALRYLSDTGIGGKATWGFGLFDFQVGELEINAPESPYSATLSNALPTKTPVLWNVLRKGGWSFGKRKPKVNFIAEGSIVADDPGRIIPLDLGLQCKVHVYGLVFPVPARVPEEALRGGNCP